MSYWVLGGDDNGAMYGGLQIAENINFNGFTGIIQRRGITISQKSRY